MQLFRLALTALLASTLASAAPVQLTPILGGGQVLLVGDHRFTYTQSSADHTVFIPEGSLKPLSAFPADIRIEQTPAGLKLTFPEAYTFSLSPDELRLQAVPARQAGDRLGSGSELLSTDERAPLIIPLTNAAPGVVAAQLVQMYPNLKVIIDDRQRALLIMANQADRPLLKALTAYLDMARPQVSFEAQVIEINRSATQKLGIDYDFIFKLGLRELAIPTPTASLPFRLGTIARDSQQGLAMTATINLLQNNGAGQLLAQPRVVSLDGTEARINATQNTPLIVTTGTTGSVQNITTGITLRMLPKVAPDGTVEVQINISVSAPTGVTAQGVPTFSTREATTVVRVANGEPIVIGGLLEQRRIEGTNKVPLLGDIPVLGRLFSSTTENTSNTDLVIIITPRVLAPVMPTTKP